MNRSTVWLWVPQSALLYCSPSYNTSMVLTLPSSLQWRTIRRTGPSHFWTPLLNQRLMETCLSLCTGNLPTQTSTYSETVTTTSQPCFSVIHTLSHRAQTVCGNPELLHKEKTHLRNALTQCKYPKLALDKVERSLPRGFLMGLTTRAPQVPCLLPMKLKQKITLSYFTHKVSVKVSRRSVGGMAYRPTSKVVIPSGT